MGTEGSRLWQGGLEGFAGGREGVVGRRGTSWEVGEVGPSFKRGRAEGEQGAYWLSVHDRLGGRVSTE